MSDKLCHCATRVVASPMEEEEVSPLEYAEDVPRVVSSEGAHSSREPSEYFDPKVGAEIPLRVIDREVEEVEVTNRDAEGSLALSQVEEEQAPQCACTQHPPQLAEDVVMRLADVSPALIPVDTGGEVSWKPVGTSWVNCRLWITFPPMYPPITFGAHLECNLNI